MDKVRPCLKTKRTRTLGQLEGPGFNPQYSARERDTETETEEENVEIGLEGNNPGWTCEIITVVRSPLTFLCTY